VRVRKVKSRKSVECGVKVQDAECKLHRNKYRVKSASAECRVQSARVKEYRRV
jgi:DUF971 family protein